MKSIAFWFEASGSSGQVQCDLHLNYWKLPANGYESAFLDIGIMLAERFTPTKLHLYVPEAVKPTDVMDLGATIASSSILLCSIFNEDYQITAAPNSKFYPVSNRAGDVLFRVYELSAENLEMSRRYAGTVISTEIPRSETPLYLRLRVTGVGAAAFLTSRTGKNTTLLSAFSKETVLDLRCNHIRSLNKDLLQEINDGVVPGLKKAHFFYIVSSSEEVLETHTSYVNCRLLEKTWWDGYIGKNTIPKDEAVLAYHFKEKDSKDFVVLVKSREEQNNWRTIGIYLLVLGALSIFFNIVAAAIFSKF